VARMSHPAWCSPRRCRRRAPPSPSVRGCWHNPPRSRASAAAAQPLCTRHTATTLPTVLSATDATNAKWLKLQTLAYVDREGRQRTWERCVRRGPRDEQQELAAGTVDAVCVLALLQHTDRHRPQEVVLVRQFRPPVGGYTVELPAGLIDAGESPEQAAVRELREETGLVADVAQARLSPALPLSPGLTNENVVLVTVDVDMGLPANRSPQQALDDGEDIELVRCTLAELLTTLRQLDAQDVRVSMS
jgi:8-oxo-dGTP pyrophosphatase MutT (NUDIX family)